ncbi:MAG: TonB-dependent receptor, partial [Gemmatimonadetes bacterium]|nr:TonB-dependent receptor [Gemmatimonadota bacterium]
MRALPIALGLIVTSPAWPGTTPARADDPAAIPDSVWASLPWTVLPRIEVRGHAPVDALGPLPLASTRLEGADLERHRDDDLATLLAPVPGLRLASAGGPAAPARPSLRGSTFEQVLVLVDGRRRNVAQGGGVDLSDIPLASVESVEIARGGASALFGGDAIGGAIQVRTRAPRRTSWRVHAEAGSFEERALLLTGTTELSSRWSGRASYRDFGTRGDYPYRDDARGTERRVQNGDTAERHAELRADADLGAWSLRLDASGLDAERGVPGSEEFPTPTARTADRQWTAGARLAQNVARPWRATVDLSWLRRSHAYREPDAAFGPIDESHRNHRVELESALERIESSSKLRLAGGGSVDWLDSTTDGERARATVHVRARSTRDVSWRGTWRATVAARVDAVEGFAPFASPRVGLEYAPDERWRWRASAGTSWRAPTFDDLFWPARATAAGNPDLRAERGRDADLGVTLRGLPRETTITVDAFLRDVTDLIQWSPGASGVWRPHNIGGARLGG